MRMRRVERGKCRWLERHFKRRGSEDPSDPCNRFLGRRRGMEFVCKRIVSFSKNNISRDEDAMGSHG